MQGCSPFGGLSDHGVDKLYCGVVFLMMCPVLAGHAPAMWVQESGAPQRRQAGVGWSPYRCAILPLYSCPHRNFKSWVAWAGLELRRLVICDAVVTSRAPFLEAWRIRRLYKEVW